LGKAIHAAIEHYLVTGEILENAKPEKDSDTFYPIRRFVLAVKDRLNRKAASSEMEFRIATFEGGPEWLGYIDYFCPDEVIDFKNFSDLKYAKTEDQLMADIQMNSYARHYFEIFPDAEEVSVSLFYMVTRNKHKVPTREVKVTITREACAKVWAGALENVKEMVHLATIKNSLEIEPNTEACSDYGGCYHRKRCGFETKEGDSMDAASLFDLDTDSKHEKPVIAPVGIVPPDAASMETTAADLVPEETPIAKAKAAKAKAPRKQGLTLYISCFPTRGGTAIDFAEWIVPIRERANAMAQQKEEKEVFDYRLLPYREPSVLLSQVASAHIRENGLPEAIYVTDRYGFESSEVVSLLRVHATNVVEGLK
jgi:hypothetical protein